MSKRYFSDKIAKWYLENRRPLPWRDTKDPYRVWLSEVILQQTRVAQGLPYYQMFTDSYPTVVDLASSSEQQVLRLWQGLGYYTRARNLYKCAQAVVHTHHGKFPATFKELLSLPGIGDYTAAAIASFCFDEPVAVLDGNVFRILARIFGIDTPINSPAGKKVFSQLANELISKKQPALHNQAVMEFGAIFCTPANPRCEDCPFKSSCVAFNRELVTELPVKIAARKSRKRYFFYLVVEKNNALLMKRRSSKDIWQGLFDFVLIEKNRPVKAQTLFDDKEYKKWFQKADTFTVSKKYIHILTHQTIHCQFIHLKAKRSFNLLQDDLAFYSHHEIARLPKPALITRFLTEQKEH
jgi:A/G-specific adenine glycosylase